MTITIYTYSNNGQVTEIPERVDKPLIHGNKQISLEEFDEIADRLANLSMKIHAPNAQPLSDYAMSRESIYENHP